MYAGFRFRRSDTQAGNRYDDSHLRYDYQPAPGGLRMASVYGKIVRIFTHELFDGGPEREVAECAWYRTMAHKNPISGNTVVKVDSSYVLFDKFIFLQDCYQQPVALWPYDPFGSLPIRHPLKDAFEVLDRNQTEDWDM
jgi:hypothetical protein